MWHVDEGALHAYLDGALDEYPPAEAHRVREHLETCGPCTARLVAERRVRDEAQGILGLAAPRVEVPTFEELRAYVRAQAPAPSGISVRLYRLSWAASVVLALGTGWLLRGEAPATGFGPVERAPTADAAEAAAGPAEVDQASGTAAEVAGGGGAPANGSRDLLDASSIAPAPTSIGTTSGGASAAVTSTPAAAAEVPARSNAAASDRIRREAADRLDDVAANGAAASPPVAEVAEVATDATAMKVAADAAVTADGSATVAGDSGTGAAVASARDAAPEPASGQRARFPSAIRQAPVVGLGGVGAPAPGRAATASDASAGAEDVDEEESVSLVVPGLEVLDVLPVGVGTSFAGMRALQRLPTGDTLETAHLPAGVDPRALPPLREGWSELVRPRGSGWLVMRAPLDAPSLAALLQRLEDGR